MAITSGFFMSVNGDRKYKPEFFAQYFASFIGNGVFPNPSSNLQVISNNDMTIVVKDGKGWIDGYILFNDGDYILNIEPADGVLNRIDRVVLRWDRMDRKVDIVVKQGNFASNPVAPELQRDADAYELALADIAVNRGIISITQANITDLRLNKTLCGIVHGVVDQVDPTAIFNQFESWYKQTKANYDADIATWTQEKKDDFNVWYTTNINEFTDRFKTWFSFNTTTWDSEFTAWFDSIKGQLDGDIAANLAAQITDIQANKVDKVAGKGLSTNDYTDLEKAEVGKIKNLATLHELALLEDEVRTHKAETMPHQFVDGNKTYKWGLRTKNGVAQFIYEEVI